MHYAKQQKYITSGLAARDAAMSRSKVIETKVYQPNFCLDCNLPFFGYNCKCGSTNITIGLIEQKDSNG